MTRLFFCGQAPSRVGDGRPFTGPSGRRLAALLMLRDYEHLASQCTLVNVFQVPAERRDDRGDEFDKELARELGKHLMVEIADSDEPAIVVACGHAVYRALTGRKGTFFKGRRVEGVEVWCFPHPSGASAFWNSRGQVLLAANFLSKLLKRSGIVMAR